MLFFHFWFKVVFREFFPEKNSNICQYRNISVISRLLFFFLPLEVNISIKDERLEITKCPRLLKITFGKITNLLWYYVRNIWQESIPLTIILTNTCWKTSLILENYWDIAYILWILSFREVTNMLMNGSAALTTVVVWYKTLTISSTL